MRQWYVILAISWLPVCFSRQLLVTLKNGLQEDIEVYWDAPGDQDDVKMFKIASLEMTAVNTFVGHKFYATNVGSTDPLHSFIMKSDINVYSFGGTETEGGSEAAGTCDSATGVCAAEADTKIIPKGANAKGEPIKVNGGECIDRHEVCPQYHKNGECDKNPGWMTINCPVSCNACHLLDPKVRCNRARLNISESPIYNPGDLNKMFSSIKERFDERYGVTVHSEKPWVVTFDNFLTDAEVDALIDTVEGTWERSTDTGSANEFGEVGRVLSSGRTSSNAWCRNKCESHPDVQQVQQKITEVTGIPSGHSESFQGTH